MISRRILAALALLWAFPCLAQTGSVKTPSQLNSEIRTIFPDNTVGQITPAGVRQVALDQVASVPFLSVTNVFTASQSFTNGVTVNGGTITNAAITNTSVTGLPTPVNPSDAVTLSFVNAAVTTGINILAPSRLATAAVLPNTPTYNNGTAGVGATLTSSTNSTLTVDGLVANLNDVILVKNQASAFQNGIYSLTTAGSGSAAWVLTRVSYFDIASQMKVGSYTFITAGTANANSAYTLQSTVVTVGTDALTWALFSSTGTAVTSLDGTNGNISVQTGSLKVVSGQLSSNVISSRTFAQTQNLSSFNSIQTQGYAAAGDGGGATYKNVGSTTFQDQQIASATLVGGSGYVNGTYLGAQLSGGHGTNCRGQATVSGNAVTAISFGVACMGYIVGDVLTIPNSFIGGSGSGMTYTVTAVSTPLGSFTDSVGTHFQYVVDQGNFINTRQFGAVLNWNISTGDGAATNDQASIQAALNFASINSGFGITGGGLDGQIVISPKGASLICGGLTVPEGVGFHGVGESSSMWKECNSESTTTNMFTLCDTTALTGQYGCNVMHGTVFANGITPTTLSYIFFSNSGQQFPLLDDIEAVVAKGCFNYQIGKGGAANANVSNFDCEETQSSVGVNGFLLNASGTQFHLTNIVFGCGSTTCPGNTIVDTAGVLVGDTINFEGWAVDLLMNVSNTQDISSIRNVTATGATTGVIVLNSTNPPNNLLIENVSIGNSAVTVVNGQAGGGANFTGIVRKPILCPAGACS